MATNTDDYIVGEALKAYESFCEMLPRHHRADACASSITTIKGLEAFMNNAKKDVQLYKEWASSYKRSCRIKWWRLMSHDDIVSCLSVLPLGPESSAELTELVKALRHGSDNK